MKAQNKHRGSDFDSFLEEDNILEACTEQAMKRSIAMAIEDSMKKQGLSKSIVAERMHTSRAQLARVLSHSETGVSIGALDKAAKAVGKRLDIRLA